MTKTNVPIDDDTKAEILAHPGLLAGAAILTVNEDGEIIYHGIKIADIEAMELCVRLQEWALGEKVKQVSENRRILEWCRGTGKTLEEGQARFGYEYADD